ncbi:hypothetical protein ACFXJ8_08740 [Nonomuraea sp. NPDC059194]|uniref:hypothetical protein n=1 Tax=Nonomuraea sp. NPDC059194 TaxID=3346764 RepID=UPI00369F8CC4
MTAAFRALALQVATRAVTGRPIRARRSGGWTATSRGHGPGSGPTCAWSCCRKAVARRARAVELARALASDTAVVEALTADTGRRVESELERRLVVDMIERWVRLAPAMLEPEACRRWRCAAPGAPTSWPA